MSMKFMQLYKVLFILLVLFFASCKDDSSNISIRAIAELDIGESQDVELNNGKTVKLQLLQVEEIRDNVRNGIRGAKVKVSVDGKECILNTGNYHLPVTIGNVQIDCPFIKKYYTTSHHDRWGLTKDARFRLWPKDSPYIQPGTFVFPIKQAWFASMTQSGNEPTYVDWGENPSQQKIYYHSGHDIGGAEGLDEIVSATDGLVVSSLNQCLPGYDSVPVYTRPDAINILDNRGWLIEYVHLDSILPDILPGEQVKMGQKIAYIGKQSTSGGWVHLHFQIAVKYPVTGNWGIEDAYPYVCESYVNQYKPAVIAVARPHNIAWTGEEISLDGSKSRSLTGDILTYEWILSDGTIASGPLQKKSYPVPGEYSEILKVTDSKGSVDYDFTVVQVFGRDSTEQKIPVLHAAYHPTLDIKPGDAVTFVVRTFNTDEGNEVWDFGDGSEPVSVKSGPIPKDPVEGKYAETVHSFSEPGDYIVKVERSNELGYKAVAHLHVVVNK